MRDPRRDLKFNLARAKESAACVFVDPDNGNRILVKLTALFFLRAQARSKRSRFITLVHAPTKSFTNFFLESAHA